MNANQVKKLVDAYSVPAKDAYERDSTLGEYIRFCLDGNIEFVTSKDFVMYDDANQMLHCIAVNEDMRGQASYPFKMISCDYGVIQQIEAVFTRGNFETFLDGSFASSIMNSAKKEFIKKWAKNIKIQAQQPIRATPYYTTEPDIVPMADKAIVRKDGVTDTSPPPPTSIAADKKKPIEA